MFRTHYRIGNCIRNGYIQLGLNLSIDCTVLVYSESFLHGGPWWTPRVHYIMTMLWTLNRIDFVFSVHNT